MEQAESAEINVLSPNVVSHHHFKNTIMPAKTGMIVVFSLCVMMRATLTSMYKH
jgi:hypothetical protein